VVTDVIIPSLGMIGPGSTKLRRVEFVLLLRNGLSPITL